MDYYQEIMTLPIRELIRLHPICGDFLRSYDLDAVDQGQTLTEAIEKADSSTVKEMGLTGMDLVDLLCDLLESLDQPDATQITDIEILGGTDKDGNLEHVDLRIHAGEVVSIVGPTGAGKSQLLADIECAARGDTPTKRTVLFDGKPLDDEQRFSLGNRLVAQLTQNMNFVVDVSVKDFLTLHARSRALQNNEETIEQCFQTANALSGEAFSMDTKVTRLSGGQSRALMIADAACISPSPILLIDEIENAGIDRIKAIDLLTGGKKIVLLATHDPLLALSASKRIVLHNGGIRTVLETSDLERDSLERLVETDRLNTYLRDVIRSGERI